MQTKLVLKQRGALKLRFQPGATGPQGPQGIQGIQGTQGYKGWSPILATVPDGVRRVLQVSDWTGGEGTKPASGGYIGASGLVPNIADAVDIRGAQGPSGSVTDGDKGDITVSSSGTVWTVDGGYVPKTGGDFTGPTGVTGAAGTYRAFDFKTGTSLRWRINADNQAESGSNAGSDFAIARFDDAGAYVENSFRIGRSDGVVYLPRRPNWGATPYDTGNLGAFGGDGGTGGAAGLVPAPAAGDAAAGKLLGAAGGWVTPPSRLYVSPLAFGAVGDGVADDGPACRTAAANAKAWNRPLLFDKGKTFKINTGSGVTIDGYEILVDVSGLDVVVDGAVFGTYTGDDSLILYAGGTIGSNVALNANVAAQASNLVTATAHGCVAGDVIKIGSNAIFEADTNTKEGELARVASVSGNNIALKTNLEAGYNTADSGAINKMSLVRSRISGDGTVRGFGKTPATTFQVAVAQVVCEDPYLGGIIIESCNTMGHWVRDCSGGFSAPRLVKDIESTGQGYGVAPDGATQDFTVFGALFINCGHAVTTSNSSTIRGVQRRITFSHLKAVGTAMRGVSYDQPSDAFDTHAGAEHVTFQNCISWSSTGSAFNVECARARIIDCEAYQPGADAIAWTNRTTRGGAALIRGTKIWNPRGTARGIYLYKHPSYAAFAEISIAENQLTNIPGIAINVIGDSAAARTTGLSITGNKLRGINGTRAIYAEWWDGALIAQNQILLNGGSATGIRLRDVTGGSVVGNLIDMGGSTGDAIYVEAGAAGGSTRIAFSGNEGKNGGSGSTGLRIDSNSENCSLAGNDFRALTTEENIPTGKGHRKASYTAI